MNRKINPSFYEESLMQFSSQKGGKPTSAKFSTEKLVLSRHSKDIGLRRQKNSFLRSYRFTPSLTPVVEQERSESTHELSESTPTWLLKGEDYGNSKTEIEEDGWEVCDIFIDCNEEECTTASSTPATLSPIAKNLKAHDIFAVTRSCKKK